MVLSKRITHLLFSSLRQILTQYLEENIITTIVRYPSVEVGIASSPCSHRTCFIIIQTLKHAGAWGQYYARVQSWVSEPLRKTEEGAGTPDYS